ncbi:nucleolar complex protein 2 [Kwoniella heveanensis CBS 569]|nr:nucleolar complex protein 2 [Kwoniella heveanensis CBS 569]
MAKTSKAFKKFASSGKLKDTIKARRQNQQIRRKAEDRKAQRSKQRGNAEESDQDDEDEEDDEEDERDMKKIGAPSAGGRAGGVAKNVEELFGTGGLDAEADEGSELEELDSEDEDEDEEADDDEEGEEDLLNEAAMKKAMKELEKKDPEFFKYLKENDEELLDFGKGKGKGKQQVEDDDEEMESGDEDDDEDADEDDEEEVEQRKISVTLKMLRQWQEGMLKQHSVRSLRKTLLAFRAAAHMNEDDGDQGNGLDTKYTIDSAQVFNKLVVTALKFTPVVVAHHFPYKTLANGKVKLQPPKNPNQALNRLVLSHFSTLLHLIKSLPTTPSSISSPSTDEDAGGLLLVAVGESTKLLPWIMGARKHLRAYLKVLLELWSTAGDSVRIASFLAVRKLFIAGDDAVKDLCLRNIYRSLLPPLRNSTPHTLPSLNLMKNTASELYQLAPQLSYQHAFGFIRMLAVHLRNVVRSSTSGKAGDNQQAFKAVYNWQFVHCIDFWSQVLAGAASLENQRENAGLESPLKPLIFPLTQISLGVIRLLPSSRYFPLRFHILSSLLRIISRTGTYIPLAPFLLEILDSTEFRRSNPKKATIKPLDFEYIIRAPAAYPKTRVYQEGLGEELVYLLGEFHASISTNIAFPEIVLPVLVSIRKHIKKNSAGSPKVVAQFKTLLDKLEATKTFIEGKRRNVSFAPRDRSEVDRFLQDQSTGVTPVGNWMRLQRKVREKRRAEVERALREERADDDDESD